MPHPSRPSKRSHRIEGVLAAALLALPLWALLAERSPDVDLWRWSWKWTALIALQVALSAVVLASYRFDLPTWSRRARSLLVVTATATVLALLVAEAVLRARRAGPYEPLENTGRHAFDADVGHVYWPNYEQVIQEREFRTEWRSNAQGLRAERDYGPKPAGTRRIVVVGDSFTVGDQVPYADTIPAVIERELARRIDDAPIEVLNAGFPGYSTANEARWIAKFAKALEPDVVIVCMTPNDLLENQFPLQYVARDGALVSSRATEADRLHWEDRARWWSLPGYVARSALYQRIVNSRWFKRKRGGSAFTHHHAFAVEHYHRARTLFELAEQHVLAARDAAREIGASFALVVLPFREQLGPLEPGLAGHAFPDHWTDFCSRHEIPVLDVLPAFAAHPDPSELYWRMDAHCTAAGYRLIGETAAEWIVSWRSVLGL